MMRPFWSYYGSAWLKSQRGMYPPPTHGLIIEPFAGSAGYSLIHGAGKEVLLIEQDESICQLWDYLIHVGEPEVMAIPDIQVGQLVSDLDAHENGKLLVSWWLGRSRARPSKTTGAWFAQHEGQSRFWGALARHRIASQLEGIRRWSVMCGTYTDAPNRDATWFIDPPYQGKQGAKYKHGSGGIDYEHLGAWCMDRGGQVIVCESSGARWLQFHSVGAARSTSGYCKEAIFVMNDGVVMQPERQMGIFEDAR